MIYYGSNFESTVSLWGLATSSKIDLCDDTIPLNFVGTVPVEQPCSGADWCCGEAERGGHFACASYRASVEHINLARGAHVHALDPHQGRWAEEIKDDFLSNLHTVQRRRSLWRRGPGTRSRTKRCHRQGGVYLSIKQGQTVNTHERLFWNSHLSPAKRDGESQQLPKSVCQTLKKVATKTPDKAAFIARRINRSIDLLSEGTSANTRDGPRSRPTSRGRKKRRNTPRSPALDLVTDSEDDCDTGDVKRCKRSAKLSPSEKSLAEGKANRQIQTQLNQFFTTAR